MRIRWYITLLLFGCGVGGLALIGYINRINKHVHVEQAKLSELRLTHSDLGRLEDLMEQWLVLGDLVFGSREGFLINGAIELGSQIEKLINQLEERGTWTEIENGHPELLKIFVRDQQERLRNTLGFDSEKWNRRADLYLLNMDEQAEIAIVEIEDEKRTLERKLQVGEESMAKATESRKRRTYGAVGLLGLLVVSLWGWTAVTISRPLRLLSHEARLAMKEGRNFSLAAVGPREVRELNHSFTKLVGGLEETVVKRTEQFKQAAAEAKAADKAKSEFLAAMSHEIRTPMNGIIGMNDLILEHDISPECRRYAETIGRSADSLLVLINQILDFSKLEAKKFELDLNAFSLRQTLEEVTNLYSGLAQSKGLDIQCTLAPGVPVNLVGDALRLKQIFANLIGNAVKFTSEGFIEISAHLVSESNSSVEYDFHVRDSGIGINEEAQSKLFRSFSQADSSTTRKYGGTGLGLAISQSLVKLMGGEVKLTSGIGEGSDFHFSLGFEKSEERNVNRWAFMESLAGRKVAVLCNEQRVIDWIQSWFDHWKLEASLYSDLNTLRDQLLNTGDAGDLALLDSEAWNRSNCRDQQDFVTSLKSSEMVPHLVYLCPLVEIPDTQWLNGHGISSVAAKPLNPDDLATALTSCSYVKSKVSITREAGAVEGEFSELKLLLVDDDDTNRIVAKALLNRVGVIPETATNGEEAISASKEKQFDVIFMDCMMPEVDGYEATRAIRADCDNPNRETPIIALTANALAGDRENCLEAGMSDYLAKPLRPKDIQEILSKWTPQEEDSDLDELVAEVEEISSSEELKILDTNAMLTCFPDDPDLIAELSETFISSLEEQVAEFKKVLDEGSDFEEMRRIAHSIKGSSHSYGVEVLGDCAKELEFICADEKLEEAKARFPEFREKATGAIEVLKGTDWAKLV